MQTKGPEKKEQDGRVNRALRAASFWALIVLIPLAIFQLMNSSREAQQELTYTEFYEQLANGNLASVTIRDAVRVEGVLKSPLQRDQAEILNFHTLLPSEAGEELLTVLREADVETKAEETGNSWVSVLISIFPWLLIIGLWLFLFRQMQAGGSSSS